MATVVSSVVDVIVFCRQNALPLYLLLRRAENKRYPGQWRLVTGKSLTGETAVQTALRELQEETGLQAQSLWALDYTHAYFDPECNEIQLIPVFVAEALAPAITLSEEHDASRWIFFDQALDKLNWPGQREGLRRAHDDIVSRPDRGASFLIYSATE